VTPGLFDLVFYRPLFGVKLLMGWFSKKREVGRLGVDRLPFGSFPDAAHEFAGRQHWELLDLLLVRWLGAPPVERAKAGWKLPSVTRVALPLLDSLPKGESIGRLQKEALAEWARATQAGRSSDPDVIVFLNRLSTSAEGVGGDRRWPDLVALALGGTPDEKAVEDGLDALRSLWGEDWANEWAVVAGVMFDQLMGDPDRWANSAAYLRVGQLDGLRRRLDAGSHRAADWVVGMITRELSRPAAELWEEWVAVRAAALVRYHLDRHPVAQADEAQKVFAAVRRRVDAEDVRVAFFRGTTGWPRKLLELCYLAAKDQAPPPQPGLLGRMFRK